LSGFLKNKYLGLFPYGKRQLEYQITICLRDTIIVSILAVVMVVAWNGMFRFESGSYLVESMILAVYLVFTEVPNGKIQKKEDQIYQELLLYFSRVKHHYMTSHHIANAVMDAADGMSHEMKCLAMELYRLLLESNRKTKIRKYIEEHDINRYWNFFLIQAYEVSEKGDFYFSENVEHIRMELMEEIYRRRCREYAYAGYVFVTIAPFFMMPILKAWGMEFTSELGYFYSGTGKLLEIFVFVVTVVIYNLVSDAKEITLFSGIKKESVFNMDSFYRWDIIKKIVGQLEKKKGSISASIRQLILQSGENMSYGRLCFKMLCYGMMAFLAFALFFSFNHIRERKEILKSVERMDEIAPVVGEEKKEILENNILEITYMCRQKTNIDEEAIRMLLREKVKLGNAYLESSIVKEIVKKLHQYERAKGNMGELLICFLAGFGIGILPLLQIYFQVRMLRREAEYEVKQFQSVVLTERRIHGISIVGLLEDMEVFARCYKGVLQRCINSYGFNAKEALQQLKQEGKAIHSGFEALADAFLSVDEVGMEEAFAEIENDRRLLEKMSQLEAKVMQEKKRDNMELLVRIPMILAVGAYFIFPFFMYSLQSVSEVFEFLETMQM